MARKGAQLYPPPAGVSNQLVQVAANFRQLARLRPFRLNGCVKLIIGGRFRKQPGVRYEGKWEPTKKREFRLCVVGGPGAPAQLQLITPGEGDKELIIGNVSKACRIRSWPLITYAKDYSPEAIASIRELHGARKRRRRRK
jgi:hypothetical protein